MLQSPPPAPRTKLAQQCPFDAPRRCTLLGAPQSSQSTGQRIVLVVGHRRVHRVIASLSQLVPIFPPPALAHDAAATAPCPPDTPSPPPRLRKKAPAYRTTPPPPGTETAKKLPPPEASQPVAPVPDPPQSPPPPAPFQRLPPNSRACQPRPDAATPVSAPPQITKPTTPPAPCRENQPAAAKPKTFPALHRRQSPHPPSYAARIGTQPPGAAHTLAKMQLDPRGRSAAAVAAPQQRQNWNPVASPSNTVIRPGAEKFPEILAGAGGLGSLGPSGAGGLEEPGALRSRGPKGSRGVAGNEKARHGAGLFEINWAMSYSPTHSRVQYHRG